MGKQAQRRDREWRTFAVVCRWRDHSGKVVVAGSEAVVLEAPSADHAYRAAFELRPDLPLGSDPERRRFWSEVTISPAQMVGAEEIAACRGAALVLEVESGEEIDGTRAGADMH